MLKFAVGNQQRRPRHFGGCEDGKIWAPFTKGEIESGSSTYEQPVLLRRKSETVPQTFEEELLESGIEEGDLD